MATRSTDYFCTPTDGIKGSKLPSKGKILSFFLHIHISNANTIRDSATSVVNHVLEFWEKANIAIDRKDSVILKVEMLCKQYHSLKKGKKQEVCSTKAKKVILRQNFPSCLM